MHATQCQQEAVAAAGTQTVKHLLEAYVEPVVLQQVILEQAAVGAERLDQLQQQCFQQLCARQICVRRRLPKRVDQDWLQAFQVMMLDDSEPMVQSAWQSRTPSFLQQLWLP
jgi:hypothetical protein